MSQSGTNQDSRGVKRKLPDTTEGATDRYLKNYAKYYKGETDEKKRLLDLTHAKIVLLRKKAPKFYEEKLTTLINQASSALLACNTLTDEGVAKFHETNKNFLRIIDELGRNQPSGRVDFQIELDRIRELDRLYEDQKRLSKLVHEFEAEEFSMDDLSSDEDYSYAQKMQAYDEAKDQLYQNSLKIVKIEGENIEEDLEFELLPRESSLLARLEPDQIGVLEKKLKELAEPAKNKRRAIYEKRPYIKEVIVSLRLDKREFDERNIETLVQDTYDAYLDFYRDIAEQRRSEWHDEMLNDEALCPKEGIILKDPDDITPEMRAKMEESKAKRQKGINDLYAKYESRAKTKEDEHRLLTGAGEDDIEDDYDDRERDRNEEILNIINQKEGIYARVKEEPRDDYRQVQPSNCLEESLDDEEEYFEDEEEIVQSNGDSDCRTNGHDEDESEIENPKPDADDPISRLEELLGGGDDDDDDEPVDSSQVQSYPSQENCKLGNGTQTISESSPDGTQNDLTTRLKESDETEILGIICPKDKIELVEID